MASLSAQTTIRNLERKQRPRRGTPSTATAHGGPTTAPLSGSGGRMRSMPTGHSSHRYHPYAPPPADAGVIAYTIDNSALKQLGRLKVTTSNEIQLYIAAVNSTMPVAQLSEMELQQYFNRFDELYQTTHYREKIIQNTFWRKMYRCGPANVSFMGADGYENVYIESTACIRCGILLPLSHMTIDHQRPQSGGELAAIARLFRACDLTLGKPVGAKGKALIKQFSGQGLDPDDYGKTPKPARTATPPSGPTTPRDSRYTLTEVGHLIFAALYATEQFDTLKKRGMHSVANLKPLCTVCNPIRSNRE